MKKILTILAAIALSGVMSVTASAQGFAVRGVVVDELGPVIGAAVMVKGTTTGVMTNADGSYSIKAKSDAVLVCQLFGYKTQEEPVNGRARVDFVLADDTEMLDATVVVGYGTLKKTQLVGSVENLSGDVIEDRPNANVARNLQGQVAGLNIIQVDGKASHTGNVYIRGNKTTQYTRTNFNSSTSGATRSIGTGGSALILIDGVEGDLNSKGIVKIDVGTVVIGGISSTSVVVAGAVKGNIEVNGPVIIDSTAVVKGDIKAKSIQINSGAVIDGHCSLQFADVDLDTFFE